MRNLILTTYPHMGLFSTHMRTSVGSFYSHLTNRLLLYFFLGAVFMLEGLFALALYKGPSLLISHMAFTTVYALHTAVTYTCFQLAVDVVAGRFLPDWGCFSKRTLSKQWLIWATGFILAFIFHRTVVLCLVHIYAPEVVAYYVDSQLPYPNHGAVFFYILPYWAAGVFITLNIGIQIQKRMCPSDERIIRKQAVAFGSLTVSTDNRTFEISYPNISHITVEDHYSRIYFIKQNSLQNVFIRTPLKALKKSLPEDLFFQIHRSHLVNLRYVSGFLKNKRLLTMKYAQNEASLPISRYRLSDFHNRLITLQSDVSHV